MANKIAVYHPDAKDGFSTGAYTPGIICDGWLYMAGQTPSDVSKGEFLLGSIEQETRQVMHNLGRILDAAGCTFDDVVKTTVHLADIADFAAYNAIYATYFPGIKPVRTTVQSVLNRGIKIEIDAVAKLP